jgi:hypothetical protein
MVTIVTALYLFRSGFEFIPITTPFYISPENVN